MRCLQLWVAVVLALAGVVLLFMGFWVPPEGEIHSSILVALRSQGVKESRS